MEHTCMLLRHRLACLAPAHVCFVLVLVERRWSRAGGGTNAPGADIASALGPITSGIRAHKAAAALHVVGICPSVYQLVLVASAAQPFFLTMTCVPACRRRNGFRGFPGFHFIAGRAGLTSLLWRSGNLGATHGMMRTCATDWLAKEVAACRCIGQRLSLLVLSWSVCPQETIAGVSISHRISPVSPPLHYLLHHHARSISRGRRQIRPGGR